MSGQDGDQNQAEALENWSRERSGIPGHYGNLNIKTPGGTFKAPTANLLTVKRGEGDWVKSEASCFEGSQPWLGHSVCKPLSRVLVSLSP